LVELTQADRKAIRKDPNDPIAIKLRQEARELTEESKILEYNSFRSGYNTDYFALAFVLKRKTSTNLNYILDFADNFKPIDITFERDRSNDPTEIRLVM